MLMGMIQEREKIIQKKEKRTATTMLLSRRNQIESSKQIEGLVIKFIKSLVGSIYSRKHKY